MIIRVCKHKKQQWPTYLVQSKNQIPFWQGEGDVKMPGANTSYNHQHP
jgi:hypothetical protein